MYTCPTHIQNMIKTFTKPALATNGKRASHDGGRAGSQPGLGNVDLNAKRF